MKKSTPAHPAGFTLVELMMTLALLGIIATVAVPSIANWQQSFALRNASQEVLATLMQARSEAMRRNRTCMVQFNVTNAPGQPDMQICVGSCTLAASLKVRPSKLADGVTFTNGAGAGCAGPLPGGAISLRSNSLPGSPCGSIFLAIGQDGQRRQARVQIDNAGNIAIF